MRKIEKLKRSVDLVKYLTAALGEPGRRGESYFWTCPFHNETNPSLSVTPEKYPYTIYCYGCGFTGDIFEFIIKSQGVSFGGAKKAVEKFIANGGAVSVTVRPETKRPETDAGWPVTAEGIISAGERALDTDTDAIPGYTTALAYLTGPERLLSLPAIRAARLGFTDWRSYKVNGETYRLAPGVVIPGIIMRPYYVKIRTFSNGNKYNYIKGSNANILYGYSLLSKCQNVVIVEGEFDAILGNDRAGDLAAFVTSGLPTAAPDRHTSALTDKRIIIIPDNDEAGAGYAERWRAALSVRSIESTIAPLPNGNDLTAFAAAGGDIREMVMDLIA